MASRSEVTSQPERYQEEYINVFVSVCVFAITYQIFAFQISMEPLVLYNRTGEAFRPLARVSE